jgi:hypothetical protein
MAHFFKTELKKHECARDVEAMVGWNALPSSSL